MTTLSIILAGFSICSAVLLLVAYLFFLPDMRKTVTSKWACAAVLLGLAALQFAHLTQFLHPTELLAARYYGLMLAFLPTSFFFFSREVLFNNSRYRAKDVLHLAPIVFGIVLPISMVPMVSFVIGSMYTVWLASRLYVLRAQRARFRIEMFFFSLFALMALLALLLGLALPVLDTAVFYVAYANAISVAMLLVVAALLVFPDLLSDFVVLTEMSYANSTLDGVDTEAKLAQLKYLIDAERHYENENLKLGNLAELMGLSSHQLSELINSQFGYGYPRLLREYRVNAAKAMLLNEPQASILSISLAAGFRSQSSFYSAFKQLSGITPAEYRSQNTPEL